MKPADVVVQLKRNGSFDQLRKQLLTDFQNEPEGKAFLAKINNFMETMVLKDPTLLEKDRSAFLSLVTSELEKEGMYQSVKEQVLGTMLQKKDYQDQIDEQMEQVIASRQESSSSSS
ncbi:hypothetical protein RO3G_14289 [Lichtheimia corymbifera JMRC:FSU:9682]|uniref:BOD1/SHG1 domain-containing protein n=1 Tax=Lichtheimia corymbifera JMRC:FSU:9682 TaxID=1263082 RepID=A0A068S6V2_9FUNG|nr:hypothetical protein RO3G_14289 [Lichtheimia corymbifera JMRC:FSU:9682]